MKINSNGVWAKYMYFASKGRQSDSQMELERMLNKRFMRRWTVRLRHQLQDGAKLKPAATPRERAVDVRWKFLSRRG